MNPNEKKKQPIKVFIRQRPFTQHEIESKCVSIIQKISPKEICIKSGYTEKKYNFDRIFSEEATQIDVYKAVVSPLINNIISGYNCTVFAYGQTGTGKTHTIFGEIPFNLNVDIHTDLRIGLIPRAGADLFSQLSKLNPKIEYTVRVSFIEIYNEEVRDLLSESASLRIYDDPENKGSVYIKDLTEVTVDSSQGVHEWLHIGLTEHHKAARNSMARSSRSHILFTLLVNLREITSEGEELITTGKLQMVDLAGSENIGKSGMVDVRARETATINKSLITFGKVIKALANKMQHVPYRDSKLTRILQDSLRGGTKTYMIGTVSPGANDWDETVTTLDYGQATRSVVNSPQVNVNKRPKNFLAEMEREIERLESELEAARRGTGFYLTTKTYEELTQNIQEKQEKILELVAKIRDLEEVKRTKEQQYQEMMESFERTKSYLQSAEDELKRKQRQEKENELLLKDALQRDEELVNNTNELMKICEVTTKHEEIFYSKYQNQCDATLSNAAIADEVSTKSLSLLNEVLKLSENHVQKQDNLAKEMNMSTIGLQQSNMRDLQQATAVTNEIQSHIDNYKEFKLEDLLKHETKDLNESKIISDCSSWHFLQPKQQDNVRCCLENLKRSILASQLENNQKSTLCLDSISSGILQKEELLLSYKEKLIKTKKTLTDRLNYLLNQAKDIEESHGILRKEKEKLQEENRRLAASANEIQKDFMELQKLKIPIKDRQEGALKMKQLSIDFSETLCENSETQRQLINNVLSNVDANEQEINNKAVANQQQVENTLTELTGTIKKNVVVHNNQLKGLHHKWKDQMSAVKDNLLQTATENREVIYRNVELMTETGKTYKSGVKKILERTSQDVGNLKNNIIVATQVGDTPVKGNYNPKMVKNPLPKQVLLEQMKQE